MKRTSPQPLSSSWAAPWTPFSAPSMTAALGEGARSESQEPCLVPAALGLASGRRSAGAAPPKGANHLRARHERRDA